MKSENRYAQLLYFVLRVCVGSPPKYACLIFHARENLSSGSTLLDIENCDITSLSVQLLKSIRLRILNRFIGNFVEALRWCLVPFLWALQNHLIVSWILFYFNVFD